MTASIKYLLTSKTPLLGWISQHFDRFMQSAVVGNYAEAWRQIHFFVTEQRRQLETHPIVLAWERSMGLLMKGEQPPVGDLQYAGFLPPKFAIQNKQTGLCIHPKSGDNNVPDGTVAHLWTGCDADYVKYEFTRTGAIRHVKSGKCLHPNQGKSDRGTRFHFWSGCDLDYLPFQLRADGNLQHVKSNQCLVPVGTFRPRNGTPLNIWDYCAKDDRTTYNIVA
ncbi:hypothetical protein BKA69DRAFT_269729 [Paraphysoderma sedebokerense]|nr:hypothetical protein BKA69DRAFT_269729 [Paraphysoderma sedebokerense]